MWMRVVHTPLLRRATEEGQGEGSCETSEEGQESHGAEEEEATEELLHAVSLIGHLAMLWHGRFS
jgi:hypothetical protein